MGHMQSGELTVGSHIILSSRPPAQEMGISGPQRDLDIIKGRGQRRTPEIKPGRLWIFSSLTQVQETDRGLSQTVTKSPTCSAISVTAPGLSCAQL